jgi:acetolactate synthase-1/2/3 large subunit
MVAQFQEENLDSRFTGTRAGYSTPNFAKVADAFGIRSFQVDSLEQSQSVFDMIRDLEEPVVVEVIIPQKAKALPKNGFGE